MAWTDPRFLPKKRALLAMPFLDEGFSLDEYSISKVVELIKSAGLVHVFWCVAIFETVTSRTADHSIAVVLAPLCWHVPFLAYTFWDGMIQGHREPIFVNVCQTPSTVSAVGLPRQLQELQAISMSAGVA